MKKTAIFFALTALLLVTGCSTMSSPSTPSTPEQKPGKYALQIIRIEVPLPDTHTTLSSYSMISDDIDGLLKTPEAVIIEFPIVYAAIGETAVNDQTETITFPESYKKQTDTNGVISVVYSHKDVKIGKYVQMTLQEIKNGNASCDLWVFEKSLAGMQKYAVAPATKTQNAVTASLPIFKGIEHKTSVSPPFGSWISIGGVTSEKIEATHSGKKKTTRIKKVSFVRILPPSTDK